MPLGPSSREGYEMPRRPDIFTIGPRTGRTTLLGGRGGVGGGVRLVICRRGGAGWSLSRVRLRGGAGRCLYARGRRGSGVRAAGDQVPAVRNASALPDGIYDAATAAEVNAAA